MCLLCGDPYSVENVLGPLMKHSASYLSGERSIALETPLTTGAGGGEASVKRKVEVILSSYHSANDFENELVHGFILVYSTRRKASLATLAAFSMNIPELPIQLLAVTENGAQQQAAGGGAYSDLEAMLLNEGNVVADRLNAHFMTSTSTIQQKSKEDDDWFGRRCSSILTQPNRFPPTSFFPASFYTPFFKEVFEKKSEIEQAVSMFDPARSLDDSGEGTLERPDRAMQQQQQQQGASAKRPRPPPRVDSYRVGASGGAGGQRAQPQAPQGGRGRGHHR